MERNNSPAATGGVRFKTGVVSAVNGDGTVKVSFDDIGLVSGWLTVCFPKSQNDKAYWTYDLGEQVRCIMDENLEDGAVLGAVYSSADAVPWTSGDVVGWLFKDGGGFSYNRATGELDATAKGVATITIGGDANINITGSANIESGATATIKAPETVVDGNLRVKGATMLEGGVGGAAGASTVIPGTIIAQDDVQAGGVSLVGHKHIDSEGGETQQPIPSVESSQ